MNTVTIHDSKQYKVESIGNGTAYIVTRKAHGKSIYLQGDDADFFARAMNETHDNWSYDDVCSEYAGVME